MNIDDNTNAGAADSAASSRRKPKPDSGMTALLESMQPKFDMAKMLNIREQALRPVQATTTLSMQEWIRPPMMPELKVTAFDPRILGVSPSTTMAADMVRDMVDRALKTKITMPKTVMPAYSWPAFATPAPTALTQEFRPKVESPAMDWVKAYVARTLDVSTMLPRIDLTAFTQVQRVTEAFTMGPIWRPSFSPFAGLQETITELLSNWSRLTGIGHYQALWGMRAAVKARRAAIRGDLEAVKNFAVSWLGISLKTINKFLDAVIAALLDDRWCNTDSEEAFYVLKQVLRETKRGHGPIVGAKFRGDRRIHSLDMDLPLPSGEVLPLREIIPTQAAYDPPLWRYEDDRIEMVLAHLAPWECQIAEAYAEGAGTWDQAAAECGCSPADGERVRRKLKREGRPFRSAAS